MYDPQKRWYIKSEKACFKFGVVEIALQDLLPSTDSGDNDSELDENGYYYHNRPSRSAISEFSSMSRRRMVCHLANCVAEYSTMITLTYPSWLDVSMEDAKKHLDSFLCKVMPYVNAVRPSIFWFLEFTKRGIPHYHLFVNSRIPHKVISSLWATIVSGEKRFVGSESSKENAWDTFDRMLAASTSVQKLYGQGVGYAVKYAGKNRSKQYQKELPDAISWVGRWWGVRGCRRLHEARSARLHFDYDHTAMMWGQISRFCLAQGDSIRVFDWKRGVGVSIYPAKGLNYGDWWEKTGELVARLSSLAGDSSQFRGKVR